ncbi:DUF423 domain-containing protein [Aestuariibacter halophilus]|uniref:DUF423 domain-containing protein n=1 Tax=Fluctibacter halophilus TaxID=226011 RepID=A0ABS8G632_9ALTE|nr:DUF423 domain-containing protein [Aestuariibacter halophilus]MCC2616010.1 DUF423 domain-containing protein [Aestuariibacter halophilus]
MNMILRFGLLSGLLSVILGAFGAHALRSVLDERLQGVFETAVRYQMYHSLLLLGIYLLYRHHASVWLRRAGYSVIVGIVLFSGSLYALCLTQQSWFGPVTPFGGLCLMAGWLMALCAVWKGQDHE